MWLESDQNIAIACITFWLILIIHPMFYAFCRLCFNFWKKRHPKKYKEDQELLINPKNSQGTLRSKIKFYSCPWLHLAPKNQDDVAKSKTKWRYLKKQQKMKQVVEISWIWLFPYVKGKESLSRHGNNMMFDYFVYKKN